MHQALGGSKTVLPEEGGTIQFAYACVVTIQDVAPDEVLTRDNLWVKRPGTGQIRAVDFERVLGKRAVRRIPANTQLQWADLR